MFSAAFRFSFVKPFAVDSRSFIASNSVWVRVSEFDLDKESIANSASVKCIWCIRSSNEIFC